MTSTFVENYETEQPILELARFMNLSQQKAAGHDADMGDSELYQVWRPSPPPPYPPAMPCNARPLLGNAHLDSAVGVGASNCRRSVTSSWRRSRSSSSTKCSSSSRTTLTSARPISRARSTACFCFCGGLQMAKRHWPSRTL